MKYRIAELKPYIRQVWRLSLPAILTQITSILMQYIDSAMVGALGANATASIGLVATSTWLFSGVTYALSAGFSVQVAHHIGGGSEEDARHVVRHGLIAALLLSAVLCLAGIAISRPLPVWLGGEEAIRGDASDYFLVFALMVTFLQLNSLAASCLQCSGDILTPSILNSVMCALDVVFNALLIPRFGVLGAGIGTALACAAIALLMLWRCCVASPALHLRRERCAFDPKIIKRAIRLGTPLAIQEIAMNGAMVVSTAIIAPLGAVSIAANSFAVTAESLCYMPGYGIGTAATTLVGLSVGAGDEETARRYGRICTAMGAAIMGGAALVMCAICPLVFRILTPDSAVRKLAAEVLRIVLFVEPLFGVSIVGAGALRGAGDTLVPSLMNLGSIWVIRIGLALLLTPPLGLHGMWIAMAVELCVRGLLMLYRSRTTGYYAAAAAHEDG